MAGFQLPNCANIFAGLADESTPDVRLQPSAVTHSAAALTVVCSWANMIEVERIRKKYNGARALDGFTLRVDKGELFGLVGPNGAGKTTLIKILSTLIHAESGVARIAGMDVAANSRGVKRVVGYMPDQPGLYQDMRVREFLEFFAEAFRISGETGRTAVENALAEFGTGGARRKLCRRAFLRHETKIVSRQDAAAFSAGSAAG